jgi:hypothetical protein
MQKGGGVMLGPEGKMAMHRAGPFNMRSIWLGILPHAIMRTMTEADNACPKIVSYTVVQTKHPLVQYTTLQAKELLKRS